MGLTEVLAIEVALNGIEKVTSGIHKIAEEFETAEAAVGKFQQGILILAVTAGAVIGGIREQIKQQHFDAMVEGLTNSTAEMEKQRELADKIAANGIFSEEETFHAIEAMDRFGVSVEKNIDLVEQLGARSGNIEGAAQLVGMIEAGYTQGLGRRLKQFGIGPDKLKAAGLQVDGNEIKGSAQEIIAALEKIGASDHVIDKLMNTTGAGLNRLKYQVDELVESLAAPFIGPLNMIFNVFTWIAEKVKDLNNATHGWLGGLATLAGVLIALGKMAELLKAISIFTRLSAIWTMIWDGIMAGWNAIAGIVKGVAMAIEFLTDREKLAAIWAAILDALAGNWAGLAAGIAVAAALGIAWGLTGGFDFGTKNEPKNSAHAQRPQRRDDIERVYDRMYGNAFTG